MRSKTCLFLILTFVLFIPSIIYSAVVTQTTAEQVALNLYTERNERALSDFKIIETFVEQENANNIYYIFNFDKTGFVIVSADDIAVPILGYVFEHNYTTENHPPQFDAMLASFKEQILYARENDLSPAQETVDKWNRLKVTADIFVPENVRVVLPLLSTTWNQGQYYNESCPADAGSVPSDPNTPGNGYVWAGCTATATAQVMKYHAHPAIGEGTHSYTDATYGLQSANFGATTYSWALMPNNVLAVNPSVHTLLYHVGVGAEMGYGVYGSGAWIGGAHPATALSALQNHFKYDSNSYYDQRNNYTATPLVWHGMLKTELDNNRPLVYDGYNSGGTDGHAFVIDGYQGASNDSYHVNWGWSGGYNGYFTLDALAPSLPNYDYRFFQAALFGVEPRKWRPLPDVSIDVSLLPYTGVDLDNYYEGSTTSLSYSVVTDLSLEEFTLTFNGNNQLIFTANPTVTSNVNIDITIRAAYTGGLADDTFNFIITGASSNYDFGDAPDSYLTLLGSNGARHLIGSYYLGTLIDGEADGIPSVNADSDDNNGSDDEDGVVFNNILTLGGTTNITVTASLAGLLQCWIDFNGNGIFDIPSEEVFVDQSLTAGANNLSFTTPASAVIGPTYVRFRFSSYQGLIFYGYCDNGEVEDYLVDIGEESSTKWEQLPDPYGTDVYFNTLLGDDWNCTLPWVCVDNIDFWISVQGDEVGNPPTINNIIAAIYSDNPGPPSHPDQPLWQYLFEPEEFTITEVLVGEQDWYDPLTEVLTLGDHFFYYKVEIHNILDPFCQEGGIYWLVIQVDSQDNVGWKTTYQHWNDVGVYDNQGVWDQLPEYEFAFALSGDTPCPVELSSFYSTYINGIPTLYWTTQSEEDNDYWNIYRGNNNEFDQASLINDGEPVAGQGTTQYPTDYVFADETPVVQSSTYWYWLESVSTDGESEVHEPITLFIPGEDTPLLPEIYGLYQNYPNPFNPSTLINFALEKESDVKLIIYNVKGAKIKTIFRGHIFADEIGSAVWDGNDKNGKQVSSGVYFYKLITDTKEYSKKMLLIK